MQVLVRVVGSFADDDRQELGARHPSGAFEYWCAGRPERVTRARRGTPASAGSLRDEALKGGGARVHKEGDCSVLGSARCT